MLRDMAYEQDIKDIIAELEVDFVERNITLLLLKMGLLSEWSKCSVEKFVKFIFLQSGQDEIYGQEERRLIEKVEKIYVYPDFYKKIMKGYMTCHIIAADLSGEQNFVYNSVAFMKIINKSISGYNIFLFKLDDGLHLGCRLYEKEEWKDCTLSSAGCFEQIVDEVFWCNDENDFIFYYTELVDIISQCASEKIKPDFDQKICLRRGVQYNYLDLMYQIQNECKMDTSPERRRYVESFNKVIVESFQQELDFYLEELKNIKSSKINTLEMLFEAEELERLANDTHKKNQNILDEQVKNSDNHSNMEIFEQYLDDPEIMIKMLKVQKGIK